MYRVLNIMLAMLLGAATARGSPWWASWNGDAYPETEGWTGWSSDPAVQRWLEDGSLFIDSRAAWGMYEEYGQPRPGEMTLAPSETFVMHWQVRVDEVIDAAHTDPGVWAESDDPWEVAFVLGMDGIHSLYEPGNWAPFTAGLFHDFLLESSDMRSYTLSIDGVRSLERLFFESLFQGHGVGFGDVSSNRSLAEWDYVECGIVPEPSAVLCILATALFCRPQKRTAAR
jgi:hypothetical protein